MDRKEFVLRLDKSTRQLIEFTQPMVTNPISENVEYLIEPNNRNESEHLNPGERAKLKELNQRKGRLSGTDSTVDLLYDSGFVPLWVNTEIYHSTKTRTIVKLICSRRFRQETDLNNEADEFPPFHSMVPLPPWQKDGERFNINWKHQTLKRKWYALTWKWRYKKELKTRRSTSV